MKITGKKIMQLLGEKNQTQFINTIFDPLKLQGFMNAIDSWPLLGKQRRYALMDGKEANSHSTLVTWSEKIKQVNIYQMLMEKVAAYQSDNEEQRLAFRRMFEEDKSDKHMPRKLALKIERLFEEKNDCEAILLLFLWSIYREDISLLSFLYTKEEENEPHKQTVPDKAIIPAIPAAKRTEPLLPNLNFCGYAEEYQQAVSLLEQYHILFIHGVGGIGKTMLARRLAYNLRARYKNVISLTYEKTLCQMLISDNFVVEGIVRQYHADGSPESDESYSIRKLTKFIQNTDETTLVYVDNFDSLYDPMLETFLSGSYTIIITTRNNWSELGMPCLQLTGLDRQAQTELFCRFYKKHLSTEEEQQLLPQLLQLLCGHPLAIELVSKLMFRKGISFQDMIHILSAEGITPKLSGEVPHGFGKAESIYNNIKNVFNLDSLIPEEKQILMNMTLLPVKGIDPKRFARLSGLSSLETIMRLYERSWILYDECNDVISLHPLISDVVTGECCQSQDSTKQFLQRFSHAIENTWNMLLPEKQFYCEIASRILQRFPTVNADYLLLYSSIAILMMRMNIFEYSYKLLSDCLEYAKQKYGEQSAQTAEYDYYMSDYWLFNGNVIKASEYIQKTLCIMLHIAPQELRTAYYIKYQAWILLNDPRDEVLPTVFSLLNDTKQILEQYSDQTNPYCLEQMASLRTAYAYYYYYIGEYQTAIENAELAYPIYYSLFGDIHADTIAPLLIKAMIYSKTGNAEEAVTLIKNVIAVRKQIFPDHTQKIILGYQQLANIYYNIGQLNHAIQTMKYVCQEYDKLSSSGDIIFENAKKKLAEWETEAQV